MFEFKFNQRKAIQAILFICNSQDGACDMYHLLKVIFFADSDHLIKYGRPITGDYMWSMQFGPVPSKCYDLLKQDTPDSPFKRVEGTWIEAIEKANVNVFSESDIECLEKSIRENISLNFSTLCKKSHTPAYEKTVAKKGLNNYISYLDIAQEDGQVNKDMLEYIKSNFDE